MTYVVHSEWLSDSIHPNPPTNLPRETDQGASKATYRHLSSTPGITTGAIDH